MRGTTMRVGVGLLAATLVLTGCGGGDDRAETSTGDADTDRVAALEAELEKLRDEPAEGDDTDGDDADGDEADGSSEAAEDDDRATDDGPVVEPRVVEVNETQVSSGGDVEVTVERVIVHDYHLEVELSATNSHPEGEVKLWNNGYQAAPMLFDEQDLRFNYQHPAGYNDTDFITLGPGQRLEAVLMFGRRLRPDAQQLTLRFPRGWLEGWEWTIALPENGR